MKFLRHILPLSLLALPALTRAQTPYLETAPLSILWNFTLTGVTDKTTPLAPDPVGTTDPGKLRPVDRVTTEVGRLITYSVGNGNQATITAKIIDDLIHRHTATVTSLTEEAGNLPDGPEKALLLSQIAQHEYTVEYLETEKGGRWELTAAREAQSTVEGALSTPFQVFLSRIEPTRGRPSLIFPVPGLRIEPLGYVTNSTETLYAGPATDTLQPGRLQKVAGTATMHFRIEFESIAEKEYWLAFGSGYLTCTLRSTPGPLAAVVLTKQAITGHGTWWHVTEDSAYAGIAPLSIKMGAIKYQNRHMFPGFVPSQF